MKPLNEWIDILFKEKKPNKVVFRVDAGLIWGLSYGHLSRCLIIEKSLINVYRSKTTFLLKDIVDGLSFAKKNVAGEIFTIDKNLNFEKEKFNLINKLLDIKPDWLVYDLPYNRSDGDIFKFCKDNKIFTLFLDDNRFVKKNVDVLLNSNFNAPKKFESIKVNKTRYLLGVDFFIHNIKKQRKKKSKLYKTLTVSFGGTDPLDLTTKVSKILSKYINEKYKLKIILGPGNDRVKNFDKLKESKNLELIISPLDQLSHFIESDFAFCAGGRTMYELLYLKINFFPIASANHEIETIKSFMNEEIIKDGLLEWDNILFEKKVVSILRHL